MPSPLTPSHPPAPHPLPSLAHTAPHPHPPPPPLPPNRYESILIDARLRDGIGAPLQLYRSREHARVFVTLDMINKMVWATVVALGRAYITGEAQLVILIVVQLLFVLTRMCAQPHQKIVTHRLYCGFSAIVIVLLLSFFIITESGGGGQETETLKGRQFLINFAAR